MAAEGRGPVAAGHTRTLQVTPITADAFFSNHGEATPGEEGKTDLNGPARGRRRPEGSTGGSEHLPQGSRKSYFCLNKLHYWRKRHGDTRVDEGGPLLNLRSPGTERKQARRGSDRGAPPGQVPAGVPARARGFLSDSLALALAPARPPFRCPEMTSALKQADPPSRARVILLVTLTWLCPASLSPSFRFLLTSKYRKQLENRCSVLGASEPFLRAHVVGLAQTHKNAPGLDVSYASANDNVMLNVTACQRLPDGRPGKPEADRCARCGVPRRRGTVSSGTGARPAGDTRPSPRTAQRASTRILSQAPHSVTRILPATGLSRVPPEAESIEGTHT